MSAVDLIFVPREEHGLLKETCDGLLQNRAFERGGWSAQWPALADAGILAITRKAEDGGLDDSRACALIAESFGRAGMVSPFAVSAIAATSLLAMSTDHVSIVEKLASGDCIATLDVVGIAQGHARANLAADGSLHGTLSLVPFATEAEWFIIPAGDKVVLVNKAAVQVQQAVIGIDGAPYASLKLSAVSPANYTILAEGYEACPLVETLRDQLITMACAEAIGAMDSLITMTRDYLNVRQQFGETLASFQVLRHRLVDMDIAITEARSVVEHAAGMLDETDVAARKHAALLAQFTVTRGAMLVSKDAVQLHGGVGMALETPVGGYFKRLMTLPLLFGDEDACLARIGEV